MPNFMLVSLNARFLWKIDLICLATCTLFACAQMDMLIHDFSRFILGVGHCACCSVSLLFVGSASWMAARNVALQIDIGHCKMHSALIIKLSN